MKDAVKSEWQVRPLGEVVTLNYGKALARSERDPNGSIPVYGANGVMDWSEHTLTEGPSLVIGRKGSAGEVTRVDGPFWPSDVTYYTTHDHNTLDFDFLHYTLQTLNLPSMARGVKPGINRNDVYALSIPLPPLEEQQRIVAVLDEAFEGLARARAHAEANLQNGRELFENSLEAELEAVGNSHETSLGEHIDLLAGFAFKSKGYTEDRSAMRLMRGDNIIPGAVRWEGAKYWPIDDCAAYEKFQLRLDDVMIAMDRTWIKAGIKYAVLSDEDVPSLLVQRVARLRCLPSLDTHFLAMLIGSKSFERYVLSIQTGTGVPHISPTQIRDFTFPLPDIETQIEIVERLSIVKSGSNELADSYFRKLQDTDDLRQSFLQKAFAGELT